MFRPGIVSMFLKSATLDHFWGFPETFAVDFQEFTTLVGPNNGGKTTVLRAIKFATDALRIYFGDEDGPNYGQLEGGGWQLGLAPAAQRQGVMDLTQFFFGRSRRTHSRVSLAFQDQAGVVTLEVSCLPQHNNIQLLLKLDGVQVSGNANDPDRQALVDRLFSTEAYFVPPLGTLSPSEKLLSAPQLRTELAEGRYAETWRNQLHWLTQGKSTEAFQRVVQDVQSYLGDVQVLLPKLTRRDTPPQVVVTYAESDVEHDISAAGGGLRTLLSLATVLELSPAPILLFDEPDAHLHSSVQRQVVRFLLERASRSRQIIVSTHAPDVIDEVPIQSLVWIDRKKTKGEPCDDVGKTLVQLGAVSHNEAMRSLGADVVLFFEATPDKQALTSVLKRCGKSALANRVRPALLKGYGTVANLPVAVRVVKTLIPMRFAAAAILDADYTHTHPKTAIEDLGEVSVFRLPCKELENLLLLSPDTVYNAARAAAAKRSANTDAPAPSPSREDVERKIEELSGATDLRDTVEPQWLVRWAQPQGGIRDPGQMVQGKKEFEKVWSSLEWRRRCCPGKEVLARLKRWLQGEPYKLSLTLRQLFDVYQPDQEIRELFDRLEAYINRVLAAKAS
jgi:energy-coupling factor transporter ATP-binding protein EcfA2